MTGYGTTTTLDLPFADALQRDAAAHVVAGVAAVADEATARLRAVVEALERPVA